MPDPTPNPWDARPWPAVMVPLAPLLAIVCPAPVARRLDRVPLGLAYGVHVVGGLLAVLAVLFLTAWAESDQGRGLAGVFGVLRLLFIEIYEDLTRDGESLIVGLIATAFFVAFIEVVTLLVAWGMTAWTARVEPFGTSFRRSLARTWLITPHGVFYIVAFGGLGIALERWRGDLHKNWDQLPWFVREPEMVMVFAWCVLSLLLIVAVVRAFASGGWGAVCLWPPQCEGCGYSLQGLTRGASCPECGRALAASTAESPRCRTRHRPGWGVTLNDWFRASVMALVRPAALGRELRVLSPTRGRGVFLLMNLVLIAAVNVGGFTCFWWLMYLEHGRAHYPIDLQEFILSAMMTLSITTLIAWMIMLACASVVGTSARLGTKRNLLPLAMQGSLCLGGLLAIWAAIGWATMFGFFVLFEVLDVRLYRLGVDREVFFFVTLFGLPILLLLSYLYWLGKITWAGRYANQ